jgi:hypothetical protein
MKLKKNIAISDSGLLFNPTTGESFSVNPIGVDIIQHFKNGKSFEEISSAIINGYNTDKDTFEKDFNDFLGILSHHQLLDENEEKKA